MTTTLRRPAVKVIVANVTRNLYREHLAGPIAGETHGEETAGAVPVLLMHGGPGMSDYMSMLAPELDG